MNDLLRELAEIRQGLYAWSADTQHATPRDEQLAEHLAATVDIIVSLAAKIESLEKKIGQQIVEGR